MLETFYGTIANTTKSNITHVRNITHDTSILFLLDTNLPLLDTIRPE
ncbi:hypothetical protein HALLA_19310 [Halostagnicola larsenii XH-48]|uniref:Uncharacterized protein n=1 Tax=Halostagnicola larsenii XH-48 TaxID=797299 RepID=W0JRE6_9EURY|nr:hypothetical protein HALLA_19310 [Halostagnicola larsenii XH-48]